MKIDKFKKVGSNKYKVYLGNESLTLYEDIILKYDLLLKQDISIDIMDDIIKDNNNYDTFNIALNYIETRMRCKKEIRDYLKKKEFDNKLINETIKKLEDLNLLNEKEYIKAYINDKINLSMDGPYKIKKSLIDLKFNEEDINDYLYTIDEDVWNDKLDKLISKKSSLMNSKSYYMFFNKLKEYLYNLGYDSEMIDYKLSNINYKSNAIESDYNKAVRKYKDDKTKITNFLIRKGYSYEEIKTLTND